MTGMHYCAHLHTADQLSPTHYPATFLFILYFRWIFLRCQKHYPQKGGRPMLVDMDELTQCPWAVIASTRPITYLLTDDLYTLLLSPQHLKSHPTNLNSTLDTTRKKNRGQQIKCIHTSRCKMQSRAALKCSILRRELEVVARLQLLQLTLNVCMHRSWAQHPLRVMPLVVGSLLWQLHIYSLDQTV